VFVLGRGRSLIVATGLGLIGVVGFIGIAVWLRSMWLGAISVYMLMNCWRGMRHAQDLMRFSRLPRRKGFSCPSCRTAPPVGAYWECGTCGQMFDTFQTLAVCPNRAAQYATTVCLDCQEQRPMSEWTVGAYAGVGMSGGDLPTR